MYEHLVCISSVPEDLQVAGSVSLTLHPGVNLKLEECQYSTNTYEEQHSVSASPDVI